MRRERHFELVWPRGECACRVCDHFEPLRVMLGGPDDAQSWAAMEALVAKLSLGRGDVTLNEARALQIFRTAGGRILTRAHRQIDGK